MTITKKLIPTLMTSLIVIGLTGLALAFNTSEVNGKEEVATAETSPSTTTEKASEISDAQPLPVVTVYKSATCGCCSAWIDHMKESGFTVQAHDTDDLNQFKTKAKLGPGLGSCHTAFVGDYAIEGHVPADDVKRLLNERPNISGLAAPGMPAHSPGMAPKGSKPSGYDVISFKDGDTVGVFTKY